jgi:hypothetical protein
MSGLGFGGSRPPTMFEYQNLDYNTADTVDPIVQNTWYTALAETEDVKAYYLIVEQTNNGAAVETIEVELTVDGTVYTGSIGPASGVITSVAFDIEGNLAFWGGISFQMLALDADQSAPLETRSLGIRVRQTTAVDPVAAQIEVNMVYETLGNT